MVQGAAYKKYKQLLDLATSGQLDNERESVTGIYFIHPEDIEFKETMKNARKKLELRMEEAMPCKVKNHQHRETCVESDTRKSKHVCIVEAHKSTRKRLEDRNSCSVFIGVS